MLKNMQVLLINMIAFDNSYNAKRQILNILIQDMWCWEARYMRYFNNGLSKMQILVLIYLLTSNDE